MLLSRANSNHNTSRPSGRTCKTRLNLAGARSTLRDSPGKLPGRREEDGAVPDTPNPRSTTASNASMSITMADANDWVTGFVASVTLSNSGTAPLTSWTIGFDLSSNITSIWQAQIVSHVGTHYVIAGLSYDADVAAGGQVSFGFQAESGSPLLPTQFTVNGQALSAAQLSPTPTPTPPSAPIPSSGHLLPAGSLSTSGNQIVECPGTPVKIAAVNWFGFETNNFAPHGLVGRGYKDMMDQMCSWASTPSGCRSRCQTAACPAARRTASTTRTIPTSRASPALQIMDKIVAYAGQIGLKIILDHHRSAAGAGPTATACGTTAATARRNGSPTGRCWRQRYANNPTGDRRGPAQRAHAPATWGDGGANDWAGGGRRAPATRSGRSIPTG